MGAILRALARYAGFAVGRVLLRLLIGKRPRLRADELRRRSAGTVTPIDVEAARELERWNDQEQRHGRELVN